MDIATIIGVVSGVAVVLASIMLGGDIIIFLNVPSMLIVLGGTTAAVFINFKLKTVIKVMGVTKTAFFAKDKSFVELVDLFIQLSNVVRKEGVLGLEKEIPKHKDPFLRRGLQLLSDDVDNAFFNTVLNSEINSVQTRHKMGQDLFNNMAKFAPAFGMIGTLIGLVQMLSTMKDPSTIGASMALALLTTLYGAFFANLFFTPIAGKLKIRSEEEVAYKKLIIQGLLIVRQKLNQAMIIERMKSYLDADGLKMLSQKEKSKDKGNKEEAKKK